MEAKDETISILQEQLEVEHQSHSEARRLSAGLTERMPKLQAPAGTGFAAQKPPDSVYKTPIRKYSSPESAESETKPSKRSWWGRLWR